jgi:ribonuclease BN (tRNA processing enzyme)
MAGDRRADGVGLLHAASLEFSRENPLHDDNHLCDGDLPCVEPGGSGDAFGSGGRFQTCLLLRGAGRLFLIDCGASSLIAMKRAGVSPREIGCVVLSHLHGDHFGGIPFLILDAQFGCRTEPLVIAGPPGVRTRVEAAMEVLFPGSSAVRRRFELEFIELQDRLAAGVGAATVTPFLVQRASGAPPYALRVEYSGKILAYSGDTEWTESLVEVARGADLFVCEAYTFEKKIRYHLDYRTIVDRRASSNAAVYF